MWGFERTEADPADAPGWIERVDREELVLLVAEGPYVRYGMPRHVTIRRSRERYEVEWVEEGDGASVPPSGKRSLDRAGLLDYLEWLLADGRPVRRSG